MKPRAGATNVREIRAERCILGKSDLTPNVGRDIMMGANAIDERLRRDLPSAMRAGFIQETDVGQGTSVFYLRI